MSLSFFEKESEEVRILWENHPIDEIVYGITCIYIFRSDTLKPNDLNTILELSRYKDLNVCIRSVNKLIEYNLIDDK